MQTTTLVDILSKYIKNESKLQEASQEVEAFFRSATKRSRRPEDKVLDNVTYKFCSFSQAYFPIEDFVNNKSYTKAAYNVWNHFYKKSKDMIAEAKARHSDKLIDDAEKERRIAEAEAYAARKDDLKEYENVRSLGKLPEDFE